MPVPAWMASLMKPLRCRRKMASLSGLTPWKTPAMPSGCIPMLVRFSTRRSVGPSVQKGPSLSDSTDYSPTKVVNDSLSGLGPASETTDRLALYLPTFPALRMARSSLCGPEQRVETIHAAGGPAPAACPPIQPKTCL